MLWHNGTFGTNPNRDFIEASILTTTGGVIDTTKKLFNEIEFDSDGKILIKPVEELNAAGLKSGSYRVSYRFLRKLAGSDVDVLVRTVPNPMGKFDIYEDLDAIEVTDDGKIFEYTLGAERGPELLLQTLGLEVDAVSPSRTEVRIKAKDINGQNYLEDFARLGESIRRTNESETQIFFGTANDEGNFVTNTNVMTIIPQPDGFVFTDRMVGGTIYINDVFLVDTITTIPTTENNLITNQDTLRTDDYGEVIKYGDEYPWDSSLHANAVRPVGDWSSGWLHWLTNSSTWGNSVHLGFWSHWVQGEGRDGGVCMSSHDLIVSRW